VVFSQILLQKHIYHRHESHDGTLTQEDFKLQDEKDVQAAVSAQLQSELEHAAMNPRPAVGPLASIVEGKQCARKESDYAERLESDATTAGHHANHGGDDQATGKTTTKVMDLPDTKNQLTCHSRSNLRKERRSGRGTCRCMPHWME